MRRTLYLNENKGLRVLRDGPSLWIKWAGRSDQRIPLRLVSRVVIIGNVKIEAGAITLFTEHDIPVIFINHSGEESAVAIPYNHRLAKHYEEQKVFLETAENTERYIKWAEAKRMVIQVNVLKRIYKKIAYKIRFGLGEGNYQAMLSKLKPSEKEKWTVVTNIVNNLFRGLITEHLLKADIDPHLGIIHRRHNFGLSLDFCYTIEAESDLQSLQFLRCAETGNFVDKTGSTWRVTPDSVKNIIHRFENKKDYLSNMVEITIDEFFELMRELRT